MEKSYGRRYLSRVVLTLLLSLLGLTASASVAAYDWPQFNGDARHSGNDGQETFLSAADVSALQPLFRAVLPGIADGAPAVAQHIATIAGTTDVAFVTTTDGRLIALDAHTGATI